MTYNNKLYRRIIENINNDIRRYLNESLKYTTNDKHIAKMKGYYNKQSNPVILVNSIKDDKKLVARWIAAMMLKWNEAAEVFKKEILKRGYLTQDEINEYETQYIGETTDTRDVRSFSEMDKKMLNNVCTRSVYKFFEMLYPEYDVKWKNIFTDRAQTSVGRRVYAYDKMVYGFAVDIQKVSNGKVTSIRFDIIIDKYANKVLGYCNSYYKMNTLKDFISYIMDNI